MQDQRLLKAGILHGCTTAADGDMKDASLRAAFLAAQGAQPGRLLCLRQTHADTIVALQDEKTALEMQKKPAPEADAWILSAAGWGVAVFTADCAPVLLWDKGASVLAAVHAGWRGAAKGLPAKTAARMLGLGAKPPLRAWIGPHIQPCCFEVGPELRGQFPEQTFTARHGKLFLDLGLAVRLQLQKAGLAPQNIVAADTCTHCGENLFSYRQNPHCGRLMTYIFKK